MPIDLAKIKKLDTKDVYGSIKSLPEQIEQVMIDIDRLEFPNTYRNASLIAISGMGGSIYNYTVITSLFYDMLEKPMIIVNGYNMPASVLRDTFFIAVSYSGSTEETIMTANQAIKNDDAVTAVTSGGKLAQLMEKNNLPFYQFDPIYNQCGQPRVGVGYTVFGPILILDKLDYLDIKSRVLRKAIRNLREADSRIEQLAYKTKGELIKRPIVFVAAEHLAGNAYIARNQLNESAKGFAEYHLIPELNHHLMEGLSHPKGLKLFFIFFNSDFYYKRNKQRIEITKKVLKKQKVDFLAVSFEADNKLEEFLFFLQFSAYLSFFLGIEYKVDPAKIPWVDYFKKELAKGNSA